MANKTMNTARGSKNDRQLELRNFRFEIDDDGVAVMLLDVEGEKLNTLSPKLNDEIGRVLSLVEADEGIRALVIGSAKPEGFVAGADIQVIQRVETVQQATTLARDMQELAARVEALHDERGKPVVAAIHGAALGGGLELALACSLRLAADSHTTILGLPEVQLGVIPGAGGTQRLPRLIGIANALDMILSGKRLRAKKALRLGLVDELVPAPVLLQVARRRALAAAQNVEPAPKRGMARWRELAQELADKDFLQQLALEDNAVGQRILFKRAKDNLLAKTRGNYPAPERALEVVRIGIQEGLAAGYAAEADRFGQLAVSPQAKALISLFFATTELKKDRGTDVPEARAREVRKIGVLGGGLMGAGITVVSVAEAGVPVRIKEIDDAAGARALRHVRHEVNGHVERGRLRQSEAERLMTMVTTSTSFEGFKSADMVIEAVFEDLELKRRTLRELEEHGAREAIFASNTSSLPISKIAETSRHPETVIGMHYFSPVEKMPLLEVVVTDKTAPWVIATCVKLGKAQGKTVIVVRDGTGFYTSRVLSPYLNEAAWMLSEGASIEAIDEAMMDFGFPVGPVTLVDEIGIDVSTKVAKVMHEAFSTRFDAPTTMEALVKDERLGRKNGRGFYLYAAGKKGSVDESVYRVFDQGGRRRQFAKELIQERLSLAFVNEASRCLEEGILRSARDGDVGAVMGLGFPAFLGGPFSYADSMGLGELVNRLERLSRDYGKRFEPARILRECAQNKRGFRH